MKKITWEAARISGGDDSIIAKAAKNMEQSEALITRWAPALLQMTLNDVLWKDSPDIAIKTLWDYLCTYCYLPRLANYQVLEESINAGLSSPEYFALAEAKSDNGKYIDIAYNRPVAVINKSAYLVKKDIALKQIEEERKEVTPVVPPTPPTTPDDDARPGQKNEPVTPQPEVVKPEPKSTHFFLSAPLNNTRINRDVQKLVEEVISHLSSVDNGKVEITLEINMTAPDGVPQSVVRTVSENCNTLKFTNFGFDDER